MFQAITAFFFWREMLRLHPFWSPHFRRSFGLAGITIAVAIAIFASVWSFASLHDLWPVGVALALLYAPMLAIPAAASLRLVVVLFSRNWRSVLDWAVTQAIAILLLTIGLIGPPNWDIYFFAAAAAFFIIFPRIAFERIYGPLCPKNQA